MFLCANTQYIVSIKVFVRKFDRFQFYCLLHIRLPIEYSLTFYPTPKEGELCFIELCIFRDKALERANVL